MKYIKNFDTFIFEKHHILSGDNSLKELSDDLVEFIRYQMTHSTKKKKEYDSKKFIYYYKWSNIEIASWFSENNKVFRLPLFMLERGSEINLKISVGRMVKGRRNEHKTDELISLKGNELAAHSSKKIKGKEGKKHTIYLNLYLKALKKNMDVLKYIQTDDFEMEISSTVGHEFTHAHDSYMFTQDKRDNQKRIKKYYKDYRADNKIKKEWLTFEKIGEWNGNKFELNMDVIQNEHGLRTFLYMTIYYMSDSEMNAYLQTFYGQISRLKEIDIFESAIYKRYKAMVVIFETNFSDDLIKNEIDEKTLDDFSKILNKKLSDPLKAFEEIKKVELKKLNWQLKRFHKIYYDIVEQKRNENI